MKKLLAIALLCLAFMPAMGQEKEILFKYPTGLTVPENIRHRHQLSWFRHSRTMQALPSVTAASWDCRTLGLVSPPKDQSDCGSCHLFSGVRSCESAVFKAGYGKPDGTLLLAEQHVMDCGNTGDCGGGWPEDTIAFAKKNGIATVDRYVDVSGTYDGYGTYKARSASCKNASRMKVFTIADYGYVGKSDGVPATQAIKDAMVKFGPISVAVAADNAFMAYRKGQVFKGSGSTGINHAVTLIGWDDAKGAWLMLNSWGKDWGDEGCMWIAYGANRIGYGAMWVVAVPLPTPPVPPSPDPDPVPPGPVPPGALPTITLDRDMPKGRFELLPAGTRDKILELFGPPRLPTITTAEPERLNPDMSKLERRMEAMEKNLLSTLAIIERLQSTVGNPKK